MTPEISNIQVLGGRGTISRALLRYLETGPPGKGDDGPRDAEPSGSYSAQGRPEAKTILVVDDVDGVRDLIGEVLEMHGYEVLQATDGMRALELSRRHCGPIHLLLTDVVMPQMGGRELADRLLKERPEMRIVFMSGYSDEAIARHGVLQPGSAFLKKPFTSVSLARCVRTELDKA